MALLTYNDLQDRVLRHLDEATVTGDTTLALVKQLINQAQAMRCTSQPWPFMIWDTAETLTLVAGQAAYVLHSEFQKPLYFWNSTRHAYLVEVPVRSIENLEPTTTTQSVPGRYCLWSRTPVAAQPAAASTLSIVSSSAADTAVTVTIRGVTTAGVVSETKTATGVTPVTTTNTFSKILNVTLSAAWAGTLTITAGSVTCLTLTPGELGRSYQQIYLLDLPSSTDVISYKFYRMPTTLVNDNDLPDIPPPHAEILVFDTLLMMTGYIPDLSKASLQIWSDTRDRLERAMTLDLLDAHSIAAQPRLIRDLDSAEDSTWYPHVHSS